MENFNKNIDWPGEILPLHLNFRHLDSLVLLLLQQMLGSGNSVKGHFVGYVFSCAILWENPKRMVEIANYVLAQWFESQKNFLFKTKVLRSEIPFTRVSFSLIFIQEIVFALAFGIFSSIYFGEKESVNSKIEFVLKLIIGEKEEMKEIKMKEE